MAKKRIVIVDHSEIIRRGIKTMLRNHHHLYDIVEATDLNNAQDSLKSQDPVILLINPTDYTFNKGERLKILRQEAINVGFRLVALVYTYFDSQILSLFDEVIYINDKEEEILSKLEKIHASELPPTRQEENTPPSQRELDVIRLIALGFSNREIAEKLYISVHTVISHRKNITSKLGIKTASGLTIYAVINKLISSTDFERGM